MKKALALCALLAAIPAPAQSAGNDLASRVNPLIGTTNGGNVFPGATVPFGMVQFSPEATPINPRRKIAAPSGYEYRSTALRGFSVTNVEGWGCAGGSGDVPIMPVTEPISVSPSTDFRATYTSAFKHADERAEPGSYRVKLANGVQVALAAGLRIGAASFYFPDASDARLLIRTSDSEVGSSEASSRVDAASRTVVGAVTSGNFCGYLGTADRRPYYTLHFVIRFNRAVTETGAWHDASVTAGATTAEGGTGFGSTGITDAGHGSGVWLGFGKGGKVGLRIGISYVSEANALANLDAEPSTSVEQVAAKARTLWNGRLAQIETTGGTPEQQTVFTTALYHALQTPTTYSDANGEYTGMDRKTHHIGRNQGAQYANFSGWDIYRSQFQLLAWLDPKLASDIAQSLLNQSQQDSGRWDRWTHLSGATHVMNGDPAPIAIADIWAFGGRNFDAKSALTSLVHAADAPTAEDLSHDGCPVECLGQRPGLDQWLKLHYIPTGAPAWGPAADTLEDVSAEFGIASLAGHLGDRAIHNRFLARAQYWKNIWNPDAAPDGGYFMNRNPDRTWADNRKPPQQKGPEIPAEAADVRGGYGKPFTPATGEGFVEGSAAQYVWMVPFNVKGLFVQMGGLDKAVTRLDKFFYKEDGSPAVTKSGPLHAELDNEPSIETPWLYNFAGQPFKTQQLVRQVLDQIWRNAPDGLPGNDDLGEMSSWCVFASMGLYPEIPGRAELVLTSPLFPSITIHRAAGDVHITTTGFGPHTPYIQSLEVDGKATTQTWLPESFALKGGSLHFTLADKPNRAWGTSPSDAPPSFQ